MNKITLFFASLLLTASLLHANIIHVPSVQPTIQAGIDVASEGDTVLVAAGTYVGDGNRDLNFHGVNLVLKSEMGADVTIIDCEADADNWHVGVLLDNGEDSSSIIDGFTFTNAYYAQWGYRGGAIYFKNGAANILNCNFRNNENYGIFFEYGIDSASCRISNCVIENNRHGILTGKIDIVIEDCIVRDNLGAGIEFWDRTYIKNCLVVHNGWVGITKSGGMWTPYALIENCTIAFNRMGFIYDITLPLTASVLVDADTVTILNTTIAYNTNQGIYNFSDMEGEYNCINSNVFGNGAYNWQNDKYAHGDEFGNLSVNPLFCDTTVGNYSLGENSPCAASNNSSGLTIGAYDIGCGCCVGIRGNVDNDLNDQIDIADLVYLVAFMFRAGPPHQCEEEANIDGLVNSIQVDIGDLVYLVAYMFQGGAEPPACN